MDDLRPAERPRPTRRWAMWLTIGVLLGAALLGGVFIVVGDQANVAGRAWLTLAVVACFAGTVLLDTSLGTGRNRWYLSASTALNAVLVALALLKTWNGWLQPADTADAGVWSAQAGRFLLVVLLVRAALALTQVALPSAVLRTGSPVTRGSARAAVVLLWVTTLLLALPPSFPEATWPGWWWRSAGAVALVMLVTATIPVVVRAFDRGDQPREAPAVHGYGPPAGPGAPGPAAPGGGYPPAPYPPGAYPPGAYPPAPQGGVPPYGAAPYGSAPYGQGPGGPVPGPVPGGPVPGGPYAAPGGPGAWQPPQGQAPPPPQGPPPPPQAPQVPPQAPQPPPPAPQGPPPGAPGAQDGPRSAPGR